jgi:hypothetical protein
VIFVGLAAAMPANASLSVFQQFSGAYDISSDGCGSVSQNCTLTVNVPVGGVVEGAYLYTSTFGNGALSGVGGTFSGNAATYTNLGVNAASCCNLAAGRMDVTSIVAPVVNGGAGGAYNFSYAESSSSQDGGALVVVYSLAGLPTTTIGILDGFASVNGDSAFISFASALNPADPGFRAEMRLGIGFSFNGTNPAAPSGTGQVSTVQVNGSTLTEVAGHCDDAVDATCQNGNLITVADDADPFSVILPAVGQDHEKYDLTSLIGAGSTSIQIETFNSSADDNIFLAVFAVSGLGQVTTEPPTQTPEPISMAILGVGLAGLGLARRRRN